MIRYHTTIKGEKIAEIVPGTVLIGTVDEAVDIIGEAGMNDCGKIILHENSLDPRFFDLKTGLAGEILQKFSNYRMKLAIVGDFSKYTSKSLRDFIRESNRTGIILFAESVDQILN
jgi:hypothetical protein